MPRLPHSLILRAFKISPLLLLVLRGIRSLESATNELRWLREHVQESNVNSIRSSKKRLLQLCKRRSRGEPLQYILGSQPFGELDIKCRRGVLIPRPETEAYTTHLAELLIKETLHEQLVPNFVTKVQDSPDEKLFASPPELKILDICSGSGCISLLLYSLLSNHAKFRHLKIVGLDISEDAVSLAEENLQRNVANGRLSQSAIDRYDDWKTNLKGKHKNLKELKTNPAPQVQFLVSDIFLTEFPHCFGHFDIIISNPPYISREAFKTETTRSVRNWEPKLALVPSPKQIVELNYKLTNINEADVFYHQLLHIHTWNKSKVLVMEVGDAAQAARVVQMVLENPHAVGTNRIEIWRDWPDQDVQSGEVQSLRINGRQIPIKGAGKMRAVVLFRTGSFETTWEKK